VQGKEDLLANTASLCIAYWYQKELYLISLPFSVYSSRNREFKNEMLCSLGANAQLGTNAKEHALCHWRLDWNILHIIYCHQLRRKCNRSGALKFIFVFIKYGSFCSICSCSVLYRPMFFLLTFFFWPLLMHCLSFFELWFLIIPLVCSNFS